MGALPLGEKGFSSIVRRVKLRGIPLTVKLSIQAMMYNEDNFSIGKAALALAMVRNEFDDALVEIVSAKGCKAVITRAGGRGDNLVNKILRNALTAAEKSGIIKETGQNRYALARCVEKALSPFEGPLTAISGAGVKVGIVGMKQDLAVAIYGYIGIPGLDMDYEVSGLGVLYDCLSK